MIDTEETKPAESFSTTRPVAILMLFLAAVVFGYFSYGRLPVNLMPELTYPTLTVRTEYPGAAPEEVENDVSRPLEEALGVIGGLRQISSVSRAGLSDVVLEFGWDTKMAEATQDVLEHLDLVLLPEEARRPLILHFDPSLDPVMELSLTGRSGSFEGEEGLRRLRRLADLQIKRALEPIKGVAAVRVKGGLEEEIDVLLEEEQLRRTGISIQQVIDRLAQENINVAGGTIQEGRTEYLVRTLNEFEDLGQIENTIVATFEGREVRVKDLGRVVPTHKERQIITRTDGGESVQIEIYREADANIVALAKRVKALVGSPNLRRAAATPASADSGTVASAEGKDPPRNAGSRRSGRGRGDDFGTGLAGQLLRDEGAVLQVMADRSLFIESSIKEVRNTALLGGLLAVIILFLFLRSFKSTMIIATSIPVSLLITFAPLHLFGVSLNIMSLGGLALGIGMLVDSSIVVLESIYRCREEGDGLGASAVRGTNEVRSAVVASILTSIAVFFPMVFVEGVAGQAFGDLGTAVVVSLLASMVVALFLIPMLASRSGLRVERLAGGSGGGDGSGGSAYRLRRLVSWAAFRRDLRMRRPFLFLLLPPLYLVVRLLIGTLLELVGKLILALFLAGGWLAHRGFLPALRFVFRFLTAVPLLLTARAMRALHDGYPRVLRWALAHRLIVVVTVLLCLWGSWQVATSLDSELLPEVRQGEFTIEVALPVGTPLERTEAALAPIERAILAEKENIRSLILTIGYDPSQSERSDEGEHTARFKFLVDRGRGAADEDALIERLRRRFRGIPDLEARVTRPVLFSSKTPIEVEVQGDDLDLLKDYANRARLVMETLPDLADVESSVRPGAPEVEVVYDRDRLSRYGLNIGTVARLVRDKVKGYEATRFNLVNRRIPIVVRLAENDRETVEDVETMVVNPGGERPIQLASVANVVLGEGPAEVRRIDGRRVAVISANLASGSLSAATAKIEAALNREIDWPAGMGFVIGGQNQEWQRSRRSLVLALALSIFLVYVIMAAQFESLIHPLVIMFTIPLAFIGTVLALKILGIPLSVVVFLGMIMLAGIVVNNAIVLVDYINTLRKRGLERTEAIVTAGSVRLRPILMTTATTVLGLTPMALGLGEGAEIRTPMAIAVISGLLTSTLLTLVIIPTIYDMAEGMLAKIVHARRGRAGEPLGETAPGSVPS